MRRRLYPMVGIVVVSTFVARAEPATNLSPVVIWETEVQLTGALGYRNNVLQSSIATENSGFFRSSAEASLMRYTSSGSLFMLYLFGEDTRYFDSPSVEYEQFFSSTAQIIQPIGAHNETGLEANYLYQRQILDASDDDVDLYRVLVLGHSVYLRPHWKSALGRWDAQLEATALRQVFELELDDYWEGEGRLELKRNYGNRSWVSVGFAPLLRMYDTREQYDAEGHSMAGSELTYFQNEIESEWRHYWDKARFWRSSTKVAYTTNRDNGSGYFDYDCAQFREQLRWEQSRWTIWLTGRYGWYQYLTQEIDGEYRERSYVGLDCRVERRFGKHWRLFFDGEHEWNISNDPLDEYRTWMASLGFGYDF